VAKALASEKRTVAPKPLKPRKPAPLASPPARDVEPLGETSDDGDLSRGEDSPAGSGWTNMGGGGDEHIDRADVTGGGTWDEDWEEAEEYGEETGLYGERPGISEEEEEE
jgi:hypothetical protein